MPPRYPEEDDHCGSCVGDYFLRARRCLPLGKCPAATYYTGVYADNEDTNRGLHNWAPNGKPFMCTACQPGRYQDALAHRDSRCFDCPAGQHQDQTGQVQ